MKIAARAVEKKLNSDLSDYEGSFLPCPCGARMTYAGRRPKTFVTALGEMTLARAYYHCKTCNSGFVPRDRALLMEHASLSPGSGAHDRVGCCNGQFRRRVAAVCRSLQA